MVGSAAHANDQQSLYEDGYAECVHGEAGRVDFKAEDVDDALSLFGAWGGQETGGGEGGYCGLAWGGAVGKQDAILAGKLLEGDGYEGANSTDDKDLGRVSGPRVGLGWRWRQSAASTSAAHPYM